MKKCKEKHGIKEEAEDSVPQKTFRFNKAEEKPLPENTDCRTIGAKYHLWAG